MKNYKYDDVEAIKKIIGRRIQDVRLSKKLSRGQLMHTKRLCRNTLARLENNDGKVSLDSLLHAAILLDTSLAEIFEDIDIYRKTGYIPQTLEEKKVEVAKC